MVHSHKRRQHRRTIYAQIQSLQICCIELPNDYNFIIIKLGRIHKMMMMMMDELTLTWHIVLRLQGHVTVAKESRNSRRVS